MNTELNPTIGVLPEDVVITGKYLDPADNSRVIIEYFYNNKFVRVAPIRLNIGDFITYSNVNVYLIDGLTYNDVYEIFSNRFGLNLIKGEDYIDAPDIITSTGRIYLPINPLSINFNNDSITVNIVKPSQVFNGEEADRNLTGLNINPFNHEIETKLRSLSSFLFDGRGIKCFNDYILTIEFRNLILTQENITDETLIDEINSSFAITAFNDGVSDTLILIGNAQIPYSIRFISDDGDIPIFP